MEDLNLSSPHEGDQTISVELQDYWLHCENSAKIENSSNRQFDNSVGFF